MNLVELQKQDLIEHTEICDILFYTVNALSFDYNDDFSESCFDMYYQNERKTLIEDSINITQKKYVPYNKVNRLLNLDLLIEFFTSMNISISRTMINYLVIEFLIPSEYTFYSLNDFSFYIQNSMKIIIAIIIDTQEENKTFILNLEVFKFINLEYFKI